MSNVCYSYQKGKCNKGNSCRFDHVKEDRGGNRGNGGNRGGGRNNNRNNGNGRNNGGDRGGDRGGGGGGNQRNLKVFENVDEDFRIREKKKLEDFRDGRIKEEQIIYSNTLTNHERRYIHALAGQLGLVSKSYGKKIPPLGT